MNSIREYFLPYQYDWIVDRSSLKIIEKSRQIGITYADAYDSVIKASARSGALDVWVSSRDEVQSKLYLEDCKYWANFLHLAAIDLGEIVLDQKNHYTAYVLQFASGRRIYCLSSNPNALAGKRGHVKLDEFALHPDQRLLYRVAKPVTTWGGTLSIISTHRGISSVFNEIIRDIKENDNPMGWSLHTVNLEKAIEQGLVERINEKKRPHPLLLDRAAGGASGNTNGKLGRGEESPSGPHEESRQEFLARIRAECIDPEQWQQEYCCQPADESTAFITYEMLVAAQSDHCMKPFEYLLACKNPLYLGGDFGRTRNLSVFDVGEQIGDVIWDRFRLDLANKGFGEQRHELYRLLSLPNLRRACLDKKGLGMQMCEEAQQRFGWKVEQIEFTNPLKEEMAYRLRAAFEDRKIRLPREPVLWDDLRAIKKTTMSSGNIRFDGDSGESHCDRFWAKALRQYAISRRREAGGAVA